MKHEDELPETDEIQEQDAGAAKGTPAADWGLSERKPGMARETKIGLTVIFLLLCAFSFVVFQKVQQRNAQLANSEEAEAGTDEFASELPDAPVELASNDDPFFQPNAPAPSQSSSIPAAPGAGRSQTRAQPASIATIQDEPVEDDPFQPIEAMEPPVQRGQNEPEIVELTSEEPLPLADEFAELQPAPAKGRGSRSRPARPASAVTADDPFAQFEPAGEPAGESAQENPFESMPARERKPQVARTPAAEPLPDQFQAADEAEVAFEQFTRNAPAANNAGAMQPAEPVVDPAAAEDRFGEYRPLEETTAAAGTAVQAMPDEAALPLDLDDEADYEMAAAPSATAPSRRAQPLAQSEPAQAGTEPMAEPLFSDLNEGGVAQETEQEYVPGAAGAPVTAQSTVDADPYGEYRAVDTGSEATYGATQVQRPQSAAAGATTTVRAARPATTPGGRQRGAGKPAASPAEPLDSNEWVAEELPIQPLPQQATDPGAATAQLPPAADIGEFEPGAPRTSPQPTRADTFEYTPAPTDAPGRTTARRPVRGAAEPAAAGDNPFANPGGAQPAPVTRSAAATGHAASAAHFQNDAAVLNGGETYVVEPHDNYWKISRKKYGTSRYFQALAEVNRQKVPDPQNMRPGMIIQTPPPAVLERQYSRLIPVQGPAQTVGFQGGTEEPGGFFFSANGEPMYRVGPDDTLSGISQRHLGRSSRWTEIYQLNANLLPAADSLKIGMVLRLPHDASQHRIVGGGVEYR